MHAIVIADGRPPERAALDHAWPGWADAAELVIGADGGALTAEVLGLPPSVVVGDADSAGEAAFTRFAASGATVIRSPVAKDETDTELALLEAIARGADRLTLIGALGGARIDHELANIGLLAHPALRGRSASILDERARLSLLVAPDGAGRPVTRSLPGPVGSLVSLLPFDGDVEAVTTSGLRYPLAREPLPAGPARGLSNVRTATDPQVTVERGRILIVEASFEMLLRSGDEHA